MNWKLPSLFNVSKRGLLQELNVFLPLIILVSWFDMHIDAGPSTGPSTSKKSSRNASHNVSAFSHGCIALHANDANEPTQSHIHEELTVQGKPWFLWRREKRREPECVVASPHNLRSSALHSLPIPPMYDNEFTSS